MFGLHDKRPRDNNNGFLDLDESFMRERKRPRPLALRTWSNTTQSPLFTENQFLPSTLTPVDSSDDDDGDYDNVNKSSCHNAVNATYNAPQGIKPSTLILDNAMELDTRGDLLLLANGDNLSPWPVSVGNNGSVQPSPIPRSLINQSLNISESRRATPIHSHFTVNMSAGIMMESEPIQPSDGRPCKDLSTGKGERTDEWHHRRLPSPISEDEDALANTVNASASDAGFREQTRQPPGVTKPASTKGKMTLSMGYRADCDKCRRKVPGHYSHIIRS